MAMLGFGAIVSVNDGSMSAQQAFTEVATITPPAYEASPLDSSNIATTNMIRTFIPSFIDPGEFSFEQQYNDTDYNRLVLLINKVQTWKVTGPDATTGSVTFTFDGILKKVDSEFVGDKIAMTKCQVKVTGAITIGAVS